MTLDEHFLGEDVLLMFGDCRHDGFQLCLCFVVLLELLGRLSCLDDEPSGAAVAGARAAVLVPVLQAEVGCDEARKLRFELCGWIAVLFLAFALALAMFGVERDLEL